MKRQSRARKINARVKKTIKSNSNHTLRRISAQNRARIALLGRQNVPNNRLGSSVRRSIPSTQGTIYRPGKPKVTSARGKTIISHSEPLGVLNGSTGLVITQFNINPGLSGTFPWLSLVAPAYTGYHFRKFRVRYLTAQGSTATGTVAMAPDYDSVDGVPLSLQALESEEGAVRSPPWIDFNLDVDTSSIGMGMVGPRRYIRSGNIAANQDIRLYDVCLINIATNGQGSTAEIGELWFDYTVELDKPTDQNIPTSAFSGSLASLGTGSVSPTNVFGTSTISAGRIGITNALNVLTITNLLPGATYSITISLVGSVFSANSVASLGTNVNITSIAAVSQLVNAAATEISVLAIFIPSAATAGFTINGASSTWTTLTNAVIVVSLVQPNADF
jgi:hypothetical protein